MNKILHRNYDNQLRGILKKDMNQVALTMMLLKGMGKKELSQVEPAMMLLIGMNMTLTKIPTKPINTIIQI